MLYTTVYHCSRAAKLNVVWSGSARKTPLIQFQANAVLGLDSPVDHPYTGTYHVHAPTCIIGRLLFYMYTHVYLYLQVNID